MVIFNKKDQTARRQQLRTNSTKSEKLLWSKIRSKKLGYKFRRQYGIGNYIVDFFCPKLKLAVEIDGITHEDPAQHQRDENKDNYLKSCNIHVIRFSSSDIFNNLDAIIESLYLECTKIETSP
ncbi:MAG: DUF559 domain-containing protein [Candidatus Jacksonbacteria bacterium]|jgi:very-short-patch-repair endonuclease|nr:DUF559 domain-containing protein [Candidatus Jacksonbacteria bacterium]MBT6034496.1 DUF559 domain-containing protein [Candidatus Jacksonbacteria bacterium]MBT6301466.1 DUF559 domain-containing protein [Candidatus Jacksonbacteria bacterium]MBT6757805.1 DUF559 domain-containing protein [Candidatus Jacksonbacteria bacterium]MBT6955144.1 DUF559 domain-containing protein [Candidatus Jacksonbacteria bacterium]